MGHLVGNTGNSAFASCQKDLVNMSYRLIDNVDVATLYRCITEWALTEIFKIFLEESLNLCAAVEADTSGLHPSVEHLFAIIARRRGPNFRSKSLTEMAAEVKVLEQE